MARYVIKRLLILIPTLIGVTFIVFFILNLTPGDPGRIILGPTATTEEVYNLNESLGYNKPYFVRYFNYLKDIVTKFDFGISYSTQKPVINAIITKFPYTLKLAVGSIIVSTVLGLVLGITAAVRQYSFIDNFVTVTAMITSVMPSYWLGMLLILLFSITLRCLPTSGINGFESYILPVATIALGSAGKFMRITRSVMLESINQDFVRTARAKGTPEGIVIYVHALKNALLPIITSVGMQFAYLLGGSVLAETVFNIPGIGSYMVTAIRSKDVPAVMTCTLFFAATFCIIMLAIDLLYGFINPVIRAKYAKRGH